MNSRIRGYGLAASAGLAGLHSLWNRLPPYVRRSLAREADERGQQLWHYLEVNRGRLLRLEADAKYGRSSLSQLKHESKEVAIREEPDKSRMPDLMDEGKPFVPTSRGIRGLGQESYGARSVGRKMSTMQRLKAEAALAKRYNVFRWQSLAQFDVGCGVHLLNAATGSQTNDVGKLFAGIKISYTWFPMYVFNMTMKPFGQQNTGVGTELYGSLPLYQLCRVWLPNAIPSYAQYMWFPVPGQANAPSGEPAGDYNYNWSVEDFNTGTAADNESNSKYIHEWTDLNLMIYGAKSRQNKIHVDLVKFHDADMAPARNVYVTNGATSNLTASGIFSDSTNGSSIYNFDQGLTAGDKLPLSVSWFHGNALLSYDDDKVQRQTGAFDKFWARKTAHPLRSSKYPYSDCGYHAISHKTITLGAVTTMDLDTAPYQHKEKIFLRGSGVTDTPSAIAMNNNVTVGSIAGVSNKFGYNVISRNVAAGMFPDAQKDVYCMIYAMDNDISDPTTSVNNHPPFLKTVNTPIGAAGFYIAGPGYGGNTVPNDLHPSFDILCRSKFSTTQ